METIQYPCGRDVIERVLPHRDPFVWVSRARMRTRVKYHRRARR